MSAVDQRRQGKGVGTQLSQAPLEVVPGNEMHGKYTLAAWIYLLPFCLMPYVPFILYILFHRERAIFLNESLSVFPAVPSQKKLLGQGVLKSKEVHPTFGITLLAPHWEDEKSRIL